MATSRWLLTVEAQDRPGIVASVTDALVKAGCNLADVSMTRLSGVFVLLAVVSMPDGVEPRQLWRDAEAFEGNVSWREVTEAQSSPLVVEGTRWNITVYGSDQPGIVAAIATELSSRGVNIDDLSTRLVGSTYTMLIDATVPLTVQTDVLQSQLTAVAEQLGVTCHAHPVDTDTL